MEFRPCIDIHNGKVKQIVGGSLADKVTTPEKIMYRRLMPHIFQIYTTTLEYSVDTSSC